VGLVSWAAVLGLVTITTSSVIYFHHFSPRQLLHFPPAPGQIKDKVDVTIFTSATNCAAKDKKFLSFEIFL